MLKARTVLTMAASATLGLNGLTVTAENEQDRIIVTGSHIKRIDQEGTSPVVRVTRDDIEKSGVASLSEFLQLIAFNSGNTFNEQFTQGFAPGAAGVDFRGFRPDRTLVLVNGRRMTIYPFGQSGSIAFVDLNSIPLSTIERIEILKDGASALYGSDAIAGVLNIITFKGNEGSRLNARAGFTEEGGGEEGRISVMTGITTSAVEGNFGLEYFNRQEILGEERDYSNTLNHPVFGDSRTFRGWPGSFRVPSLGNAIVPQNNCPSDARSTNEGDTLCLFDYAPGAQISPETSRLGISTAFQLFMGDFDLFTRAMLTQVETISTGFFDATGSVFTLSPGIAGNLFGEEVLYARGFPEFGPPTIETTNTTLNLLLGASGSFRNFDWETAINYVDSRVDEVYAQGWMDVDAREQLVSLFSSGAVNITQPLPQGIAEQLTRQFDHDGESSLMVIDARISGPITDLEAGPVWLAAGIEYRQESFLDDSDEEIINGEVLGLGASAAKGDREAFATYAELALPLGSTIELSTSMRFDYYSDFGGTANPKLGIRWTPIDSLLLRYSFGTGFKAPGLHELNSAEIVGSQDVFNFVLGGNPNLEAEESMSHSFGVLYNPLPNIELSMDLWVIEADNLVSRLGAANIVNQADDEGFFCSIGTEDDGTGNFVCIDGARLDVTSDGAITEDDIVVEYDDAGGIAIVRDKFVNIAGQNTNGVDFGAKFSFTTDFAEIEWRSQLVYVNELQAESFPGNGFEAFEGTYQFPEIRANSLLKLQTGIVSQALSLNYVGSYEALERAEDPEPVDEIDAWLVFDYQISVEAFQNFATTFGIKNLLNEEPPTDFFNNGQGQVSSQWPYYNQSLHNPQGRFYFFEVDYSF